MELLGRAAELEASRAALVLPHPPAGLVISGAPGVGKSALCRAVLDMAGESGWRILSTVGLPGEADVPLAALADILDPAVGHVLAQLPGVQAQALRRALRWAPAAAGSDEALIARATVNAVRALAAPRLLVAIDDEQWLDADSRRLLGMAVVRLGDAPVSWLIVRRDEPAGSALPTVLGHGLGTRVTWLRLSPLDEDHLSQLVLRRFPGPWSRRLLREIVELADGSAYTALELARETVATGSPHASAARIPASIADSLRARLRRLSPLALTVAQLAAVTPRPTRRMLRVVIGPHARQQPRFAADALVEGAAPTAPGTATYLAAGMAPDMPAHRGADTTIDAAIDRAIEETLAAEVLANEPPDPVLWFTHPLLREVASATLTGPERRCWHRRLAAAARDPDEAAAHLAAGAEEPDEALAGTLQGAAEHARSGGAPARAAALAEAAVAFTPDATGPLSWRRRLLALDCLDAASEFDRARELAKEWAVDVPAEFRGELAARRGRLASDFRVGAEFLSQAVEELSHDHLRAAHVGAELAVVAGIHLLQLARARTVSRDAVSHARLTGDPVVLRGALAVEGFLAALAGRPEAGALLRSAVALPGLEDTEFPYYSPETRLAMWHMWRGEVAAARELHRAVLSAGERRGWLESANGTRLHLAEVEWRAGRWADAAVHVAAVDRYMRETTAAQAGLREYGLSLLAGARGEADRARSIARAGLRAAEQHKTLVFAIQCRSVLGQLELSVDDPAAAVTWLHPAVQQLRDCGLREPGLFVFPPDLVEAYARVGRPAEAAALLRQLQDAATWLDHPWARITSGRAAAAVHLAARDPLGAVQAVCSSVSEARERELPVELGRCLLTLGSAQRRARRRREARGSLEEAIEVFDRLGASRWAALARAECARLGGGGDGVLTPSERRVTELVSQGLSNAEIATAMVVSVKTVEVHLTRVYRKLGARNRVDLARRAV